VAGFIAALVPQPAAMHKPRVTPPEIFDRNLRRIRRNRIARDFARFAFLRAHMIEELLDRLDDTVRSFIHALDLGASDGALGGDLRARGMQVTSTDAGHVFAQMVSGLQCDEDRLPFAPGSFDLVMSAGGLDSVNDLPGALALVRRSLKPDGLFLGAFLGAGSLSGLKAAMLAADLGSGDTLHARIHPQIDVRTAGDLLVRAGFALPVADGVHLTVRYSDIYRLMADLRGMGLTNLLSAGRVPLTRARLAEAASAYALRADADGRISEPFEIICVTGWAPGPDQPQPARRGSATASLSNALKSRS